MEEEIVDIFDEDENIIGSVPKTEMRELNLLHMGGTILVFNSKGEIFVHKRIATKDLYPSYYDMTIGGGGQKGETYEECAIRELEEETGIKDYELKFLFKMRYKSDVDNFFTNVYSCVFDGEIKIQKEEIEHGKFMTIQELKELIKKEKFCPDALEVFRRYEEM